MPTNQNPHPFAFSRFGGKKDFLVVNYWKRTVSTVSCSVLRKKYALLHRLKIVHFLYFFLHGVPEHKSIVFPCFCFGILSFHNPFIVSYNFGWHVPAK